MSSKPLPNFASQWIEQWKQAAPRLQAIRDEELRRLGSVTELVSNTGEVPLKSGVLSRLRIQPLVFDRNPERNGMVIMQQWFMRRHLLEQVRLHCEKP